MSKIACVCDRGASRDPDGLNAGTLVVAAYDGQVKWFAPPPPPPNLVSLVPAQSGANRDSTGSRASQAGGERPTWDGSVFAADSAVALTDESSTPPATPPAAAAAPASSTRVPPPRTSSSVARHHGQQSQARQPRDQGRDRDAHSDADADSDADLEPRTVAPVPSPAPAGAAGWPRSVGKAGGGHARVAGGTPRQVQLAAPFVFPTVPPPAPLDLSAPAPADDLAALADAAHPAAAAVAAVRQTRIHDARKITAVLAAPRSMYVNVGRSGSSGGSFPMPVCR